MRCPHCDVGVQLQYQDQSFRFSDKVTNSGYELQYDFCPECKRLIIELLIGPYRWTEDGGELSSVDMQQILYPKISSQITDQRIPENYRKEFNEAKAVSSISTKASAALSRRLLEQLLVSEYGLTSDSLAKKIDKFLTLPAIPQYIKDSIDAIRNIGNMGAHPFQHTVSGEIVEVDSKETEWLLEVLADLFDFAFIQPAIQAERARKLNEKLQSLGKPPKK